MSSGHDITSIPPPPKRHRKQATATSIKVKVEKLDFIDLSHDSDEGNQSGAAWVAPNIYYDEPSAKASTLPTLYATGLDLPQQDLGNSILAMNDVDIVAAEQPCQITEDNDHSPMFNPGDPAPTANTPDAPDAPDACSEKPAQLNQQLKPQQLIKRVPAGAAATTVPSPTISIRTSPAKLIRRVNPLASLLVPPFQVIPPIFLPAPNKIRVTQATQLDHGPSACGAAGSDTADTSRFPPTLQGTATTKKRTPVKPNSSSTLRNLYLIDYIKYYPDTTAAEYKVVWDSLVSVEVKQEYTQQRKPDVV
ncbi:hypothetical protein BDN71DRAFT_1512992 [Pleurotus eryngii]|uniref:Uncharacterized protein n=1 Tax=Pleurotus eryngii TaxID=5323 RepID=A0A9P5ZIR6_PLEER|nr:hypothetical protein BDN71DRAFT_1512992 [Pleurotus eryngii]